MRKAGWILALVGLCAAGSAETSAATQEPEAPRVRVVERAEVDDGTCPVTVRTEGLPAVSADSGQVAFEAFVSAGETDVHRLRLGTSTIDLDDGRWGGDDCDAYARALRAAASRANLALAAERWRPMAELDVLLPAPDDDAHALDPMAFEPDERPVELVLSRGKLIARTAGVNTYMRVEAPWSRKGATLQAVHGDVASGALLVQYALPQRDSTHHVVTSAPASLFDRLAALAGGSDDRRRG